jgi:predicted ATPase
MSPSESAADHRLGRYQLIRSLGRGSSGEVWEASGDGLEAPVALKLLRERPREAQLATPLQHPHVVETADIGEHEGQWYVAMELVRGASLAELLADGPMPALAVLEAGIQACAGLGYLHARGLVHRDVKLSNLLLDRSGLLKLADLGLGEVWGTPSYAAPELSEGGAVDGRTDLFALGVTLFTLATATRPFGTGEAALRAVQDVEGLLASGLLRPVGLAVPGLDEVLSRCLRARPEDRWASAAELADALGALRARSPAGPGLLDVLERPRGSAGRGGLPLPASPLFGRGHELEELTRLLRAGSGLVTLLGMGGSGKTRLALEAARTLEPELAGGAWWVDLAEAVTPDGLCFAVARGLGLRLVGADPVGQIGRALRARGRALVVLDNLEQLVEHAALVGRWVSMAPQARLLCTSRVALRLDGERRFPLGALSVPDGVALFLARAPVPIEPDERAQVEAIVEAVEGLPLALELAAARTRLMRAGELLRRLKNALRLLAGGERDVPARHRSLRASLLGSWELLSPAARTALAQLSVFEGGATLASASAVLGALDVLQELGDASLVRVDPATGRLGAPAVVCAFAAEHLPERERQAAEERHGAFYARLGGDEALAALSAHGGAERTRALMEEADNLMAALRRAGARGDAGVAAATLRAAWVVLEMRGPVALGCRLAEQVLSMPSVTGHRRAQAALVAGLSHHLAVQGEGQGTPGPAADPDRGAQARSHFEAALAGLRAAGDRRGESIALRQLGVVARERVSAEEARSRYEGALAIQRELGARRDEAVTLEQMGLLMRALGQGAEARATFERALAILREVGDRRSEGAVLGRLADLSGEQGRLEEARRWAEAALVVDREVGDHSAEGTHLTVLGGIDTAEGRLEQARARYEAALLLHRQVGNGRGEALVHTHLGTWHGWRKEWDGAREHFEAALTRYREIGNRLSEGIALNNLATLYARQGQQERALEHLEAALAVDREVGNRRAEAVVRMNLSLSLQELGRILEARDQLLEALVLHRQLGNQRFEAGCERSLAILEAERGDFAAASEALGRCERLTREPGGPFFLAMGALCRAELAWLRGDRDAAWQALAQAEALACPAPAIAQAMSEVRARFEGAP